MVNIATNIDLLADAKWTEGFSSNYQDPIICIFYSAVVWKEGCCCLIQSTRYVNVYVQVCMLVPT